MAAFAVAMPRLGMTMEEGRVIEWAAAPGDFVAKGATLLIIESEKAEVEVEATASGTLRCVYAQPDETLPCGSLLAALTETPDEPFDAEAFRREHGGPPSAAGAAASGAGPRPAAVAPRSPGGRATATPAARRLARERGVALETIAGSGPGGRVTASDVEAAPGGGTGEGGGAARVAVADGVFLEVPRQGEGEPVLLLPGFGTDVSVFARQVPALAGSYELFGVNPRGVGASDPLPDGPWDPARSADDAAAVAGGPAHVIGTSLGAAVAVELALRHPERVRSLALVAPLRRAGGRLLAVSEAWCRLAAEAKPETLAAALLPWFFSPGSLRDDRARERLRRGLASTLCRVPAATLECVASGLRDWERSDEELGALRAPTLVLVGDSDLLTPDGAELARRIPGARCVVVPEAGHAVGLEAPEPVNAALLEHLVAASG